MRNLISSFAILIVLSLVLGACSTNTDNDNSAETTEPESTVTEAETDQFGGLALYTVRDAMGEDPKGTLQKVADAGYAYVEAAGYEDGKFYGMEPEEFKSYLESLGLTPKSTHQSSVTLDNADQMIADVAAAGFEYFVIPVPPMGMFKFDMETRSMGMNGTPAELAGIINNLGEKCQQAGLKLLYHNHDFEYKPLDDGTVIIEYLLENCDPEYVNFQMDLFWVTKAGADPLAYFDKYPGRFKAWHVKDMNEEGQFAAVGTGTIDFSRILEAKAQSGMECYFVEQDQTFDVEPLEAIQISHEGLSEIGFK
jgi:sugar phosphate isomerase/epimerase